MPRPTDNLRVDGDRLWAAIHAIARIGPGVRGGNNRQTLTDADGEARRLFQSWCEASGLTVAVDRVGNMFARRPGTDPALPSVLIGSHLDTQPTGGRYDGVLGVLAGLEVIRTLDDLGIRTRHPIEVVNWTNEEGTRFAPAMLGSGVFAGVFAEEFADSRADASGVRFAEALERIGFRGALPAGGRQLRAYYELHIEQGPILEDEGIDIGVVTHGQGVNWLQVTLTGREAHSGSTPMARRVDAGLGAARMVELANHIAWRHAPLAVGTVGHLDIHPNSRNIIPGKAVFTVDFRHPEKAVLAFMGEALRSEGRAIADEIGLAMEIEEIVIFDPVTFDADCVATVRAVAHRLGYTHRDIVSGAGHDACWINRIAPAAMIFCPCVDGLSHNEDEAITREWAAAGADVLFHAVLETAEIVG